jgi:hypothetical protein
MSLEVNRMRRLLESHERMTRLLAHEDFAGREIDSYREELFRSLEALDAGIADQLVDAMRLIYAGGMSLPEGDE